MGKERPPGQRPDDEGYPSDAEIVAMTIRHGADYTKQYLDAIGLERARRGIEEDDEHA
jgi:hypothetical protein